MFWIATYKFYKVTKLRSQNVFKVIINVFFNKNRFQIVFYFQLFFFIVLFIDTFDLS